MANYFEYETYVQYYYDNPMHQKDCDAALTDYCRTGSWRVHSVESRNVVSMNNGASLPGRIYLLVREVHPE